MKTENRFTCKLFNHLLSKIGRVCSHCTISVPNVYWTIEIQDLSLKVDFLFQSFDLPQYLIEKLVRTTGMFYPGLKSLS